MRPYKGLIRPYWALYTTPQHSFELLIVRGCFERLLRRFGEHAWKLSRALLGVCLDSFRRPFGSEKRQNGYERTKSIETYDIV